MSVLEIILLLVTIVGSLWQGFLLYMAATYIRAGYVNVRFGVLPGLAALIAGTWLLFLVAR